jgi:hypothetical protein
MLTDQIKELLTAFIDGELSQRQRKAVMRLLHRSSEARELVRQLQENAHKLKQLPRHKVEPSLVDEVLQAIAEQKAQPKPATPSKRARRRWMPYVAATLAASLLIAAMGILYWKSMNDANGIKPDDGIAKNDKKLEPPVVPTPTPTPRKANPMLAQILGGTFEEFITPVPPAPPLVFTASFRDLQKAGEKTDQLAREVTEKKAVQFDITVKDNFVAMDRLKSALSAHKIEILSDPNAAKALKDKKKVDYLVYVENMTPDELTRMMQDLSKNDTTGMGGSVPSPYQKVIVKPITKNENQKLASLLGLEPSKMATPNNTKPEPMKDWRKAVLLPLSASGQPSAQVGEFVNQRRTPQAGTVQVLIKIHQEK